MEPAPQKEQEHAVQDDPTKATKKKGRRRKPKKKVKKEAGMEPEATAPRLAQASPNADDGTLTENPLAREFRAVPTITVDTETSFPAQRRAESNNGIQSSEEEGILRLETNMAATRLSGSSTTTQRLAAEGGQNDTPTESGQSRRSESEKVWQESEVATKATAAAKTAAAAKTSEHITDRISSVKTTCPIPVSTPASLPLKPALRLPARPPQTLPPRPANFPQKPITMASAGEGENSKLPDKKGDENKNVNDSKGGTSEVKETLVSVRYFSFLS